MANGLLLYPNAQSNAVESANAYQLVTNAPLTSNNFPGITSSNTLLGTATGWGEITSHGTGSAWAAAVNPPAASGKGFFFDSSLLDNCLIPEGAWFFLVRLSCAVGGNPTAETVNADIFMRWFLYRAGTYFIIVGISLLNQTIANFNDFGSLYSLTTQDTFFHPGDRLYMDILANVHTNTNGDAGLQLRYNSIANGANTSVDNFYSTPGFLPVELAITQAPAFPPTAILLKEN